MATGRWRGLWVAATVIIGLGLVLTGSRTASIGLYSAAGDLLEGGGMHDIVDVIERPIQTIAVPHVADEVANARVLVLPELLLHLELLQLVAAEDDQLARPDTASAPSR